MHLIFGTYSYYSVRKFIMNVMYILKYILLFAVIYVYKIRKSLDSYWLIFYQFLYLFKFLRTIEFLRSIESKIKKKNLIIFDEMIRQFHIHAIFGN